MSTEDCPAPEALAKMIVSGAAVRSIINHLSECARCARLAEQLRQDCELARELHDALHAPPNDAVRQALIDVGRAAGRAGRPE